MARITGRKRSREKAKSSCEKGGFRVESKGSEIRMRYGSTVTWV
jgi:hypothetical protein